MRPLALGGGGQPELLRSDPRVQNLVLGYRFVEKILSFLAASASQTAMRKADALQSVELPVLIEDLKLFHDV